MKVGFTGTREGMSVAQMTQMNYLLAVLKHADQAVGRTPEFHHGGAEGADTQAARAAQSGGYQTLVYEAGADPLRRNRDIVNEVDVLIAAPRTDKEELRSGTWATVRYARAAGKPVVMLSRGKP